MKDSIFQNNELNQELFRVARKKTIQRDELLISTGDEVYFVPFVLDGALRVVRQNNDGKEVFMYHLYSGETCALALNCCQMKRQSMVKIIAEDESQLLMIPIQELENLQKFEEWKLFVHQTYGSRFAELLHVIDLIAFSNMDKQVLHYLQERSKAINTSTLFITHQQIADEMHAQREAISRLLRTMEQKNLVRLGRNTIEIL